MCGADEDVDDDLKYNSTDQVLLKVTCTNLIIQLPERTTNLAE
jgi:hypothetical protein